MNRKVFKPIPHPYIWAKMPALEREIDKRGRVTIPPDFVKNWGNKIIIHPDYCASLIRPKNVPLREAIKSTKILVADMEHQLEMEEEKRRRKKK